MPELPEVEVHARRLTRWSGAAPVSELVLVDPAAVRSKMSTRPSDAHPDGADALSGLVGSRSQGTVRRGKRLGWRFAGGDAPCLLIHLGMTGRWVLRQRGAEPPRAARLGLVVAHSTLWFADTRRFGCVVPVSAAELDARVVEGLGPDALDPMPPELLAARVGRGRAAVKTALMDQARIAGLGNIHAVEALWRARVHPMTRADAVAEAGWRALAEAIPAQLAEAVQSFDGEGDVRYVSDGADSPFAVYGREGDPCPRCGAPIGRVVSSGRATFWCTGCQRA